MLDYYLSQALMISHSTPFPLHLLSFSEQCRLGLVLHILLQEDVLALVLLTVVLHILLNDLLIQSNLTHKNPTGQIGMLTTGIGRGQTMKGREPPTNTADVAGVVAHLQTSVSVQKAFQRFALWLIVRFFVAGRKRRRSLSPWERDRYEPRPRYGDDYGAISGRMCMLNELMNVFLQTLIHEHMVTRRLIEASTLHRLMDLLGEHLLIHTLLTILLH